MSLLEVRNLTVQFPSRSRETAVPSPAGGTNPPAPVAVRDLNLSIAPGEVLGLVGESGSGKSVASLAVMKLLPMEARISGEVWFENGGDRPVNLLAVQDEEMRKLRGSAISMIFQEPMTALNPTMRVGDQVAEAAAVHSRISKNEAWDRAVTALREVAIPDAARRARDYPHQLSGGMRQRVMIAMAIVNRPRLLIADEPTTALDVTVQAQILELLGELRQKFKLAMLFISHDLAVVSNIADKVAVMYAGSLVEVGATKEVFHRAMHPYTRGLLSAVPTLKTDRARPLQTIEGTVPPIQSPPPGCVFEPRCDLRQPECTVAPPPLVEVSPGHWARCPVLSRP